MNWRGIAFKAIMLPFVISCNELPEKPNGDLCTIDLPRKQLICSEIPKDETAPTTPPKKISLELADKYVAFSPETWKNIVLYIQELKMLAESKKAQLELIE